MGNTLKKYKTFIYLSYRREIISEKSVRCVITIARYLKLHVRNREVFRESAYRRSVRQIAAYIGTGSNGLENILMESSPIEVAAALQYFLIRLPRPILPTYIQALALDADSHVLPETVAADILGLIYQDIQGRHLLLISVILDLLNYIRKHAAADELAGSRVPVTMLPVFFQLQRHDVARMRILATIFMEIVNLSSTMLPIAISINHNIVEQRSLSNTNYQYADLENYSITADLLQYGALHQILVRRGSEGDAQFPEIIQFARRNPRPSLKNPAFGYYTRISRFR